MLIVPAGLAGSGVGITPWRRDDFISLQLRRAGPAKWVPNPLLSLSLFCDSAHRAPVHFCITKNHIRAHPVGPRGQQGTALTSLDS